VLQLEPLPDGLEEAVRLTQPQAAHLEGSDPAATAEPLLELGVQGRESP